MLRRIALLALVFLITAAAARPYGVDDLLHLEGLGAVALAPGGRQLVIETRAAYASAPRFDYDGHMGFALGRLRVVDLAHPGPARPLLAEDPGVGDLAGPFSPSGRSLVIFRHRGQAWKAGVVRLADGAVRWLDVAPDLSDLGRTVQWRSEHELILIALADGCLPRPLRVGSEATHRLPALWRRSAAGRESAFTVFGSGRYAGDQAGPPVRRLLRIELAAGRTVELARGAFLDLEISPDGRYVAALAAGERLAPPAPGQARMGDAERRGDLRIIDLATGAVWRPLPGRDLLWSLLSWSPTAASLLVFDRAPGESWPDGTFTRLDVPARAVHRLGAAGLSPDITFTADVGLAVAHAAWLGETPVIRARPASAPRADWFRLGEGRAVNLTGGLSAAPDIWGVDTMGRPLLAADGALWRLDVAGRLQRLTARGDWRPAPASTFGAGLRIAANPPRPVGPAWAIRAAGARLEARDLAAADRAGTVSDDAGARVVAVGANGLVLQTVDAHGVGALSDIRPGRPPLRLLTLNARLAQVAVATPRPIRHAGPDGRALTSWLYLPPGARPGLPRPLIVLPYPGAVYEAPPYTGRPDALALSASPQVLAGRGYAVLVPSLPRRQPSTEPAEGLASQILAVVDQVVAAGDADPDRMALWGHSFGGYAALVTATRTDRFKAIIAANGVADLASVRGGFAPAARAAPEDGAPGAPLAGWSETGQGGLGVAPWDDPQRYLRNSPVFGAGQVRTPVLLIGGDMDFVGLSQSEEMFSALWRQNKDAKLITFWGEGHVIASPANVRVLYAEAFGFLDGLIGAPPPLTPAGPGGRSAPPRPGPRPRSPPGP